MCAYCFIKCDWIAWNRLSGELVVERTKIVFDWPFCNVEDYFIEAYLKSKVFEPNCYGGVDKAAFKVFPAYEGRVT